MLHGGFVVGLVSTLLGMALVLASANSPGSPTAEDLLGSAFRLNAGFLVAQLVIVSTIWLMQTRHGRLRPHGAPGQGATFSFTLPLGLRR